MALPPPICWRGLPARHDRGRPGAERIAIDTYSDINHWLHNDDSTTQCLIEHILDVEDERGDEMANLLTQVED